MHFHVLTLFPEMIDSVMQTSIMGRAVNENKIKYESVNIRDFSTDKNRRVDDYTFGGGAGMLMEAEPVYSAWKSVCGNKKLRTVFVTPQGRPFNENLARELAKEEDLVILCGHYEGIDVRVLEETVTDEISIGDYVLTGGELAALVIMDAVARLVPGVLNNDESSETESFYNDLLEYPQFTRPRVWHEKEVPEVLFSGNKKKIDEYRLKASIEKTKRVRPDLYNLYEEKEKLIKRLKTSKREYISAIEALKRGYGEIVVNNDSLVCVKDKLNNELHLIILGSDTDFPEEIISKTCVIYIMGEYEKVLERFKGNELYSIETGRMYLYTEGISLYEKNMDENRDKFANELNQLISKGFVPWTFIKDNDDESKAKLWSGTGFYKAFGKCIRIVNNSCNLIYSVVEF